MSSSASGRNILTALIGLLFVDLVLHTRGYQALKRRLARYQVSDASGEVGAELQSRILAAIDRAAVVYPRRAMCLQRSAVMTWLLRRHGIAADMVIGIRHTPFYAHAWVEVQGRVVSDAPQVKEWYPELERV